MSAESFPIICTYIYNDQAHTKASPVFIRQLLFGNEMPDTYMQFVDVREVAAAHVAALKIDSAAAASTPRFIIAGDAATHGKSGCAFSRK